MKVGIMQPYFLPYLGYFQLMSACDKFVVYDNIKFTKKGWIHRNRMLLNGSDQLFSLPLKNDSDFLDVRERYIGDNFDKEKMKILGQIKSSYGRAPCFAAVYPMIESIFNSPERNLFAFIYQSLETVKGYLSIDTPLIISSGVDADHTLKGKERVMAICKALSGDTYINPIGGMELYDKDEFKANGIVLHFHKMRMVPYIQGGSTFVPALSILDVMMYNNKEQIHALMGAYDLI